jgi:hypothetical protein
MQNYKNGTCNFTVGLKKKRRNHYSNDAKEIIRNVYKNVLESGDVKLSVKKQPD